MYQLLQSSSAWPHNTLPVNWHASLRSFGPGSLSWAINSYIPYIVIFFFYDDLTYADASPQGQVITLMTKGPMFKYV